MPWVRLDDQFTDHPKIVAAGPLAAWLYIAGLCYCNRFLTNGFIPTEQVVRLAPHSESTENHLKSAHLLASKLCALRLWTPDDRKGIPGFTVHDFLRYQSSRAQIIRDREANKSRQDRFRNKPDNGRRHGVMKPVSHGRVTASPLPLPLPRVKKEDVPPAAVSARSKRPMFKGQRLVVFEWQVEDCVQVLGTHTDEFHLDEWFDALDRALVESDLVLPKRDGGRWLQGELLKEVKKRRLPIAGQTQEDDGTPWAWQCPKCGEIHEGTAAQNRQLACLKNSQEA